MNPENHKENQKIANLGLVAACMVVLMHSGKRPEIGTLAWYFYEITTQGVCRAAVPFFFLVSGFFLARHMNENGWWCKEIGKRIKTLLIPFWLWNVVYLIFLLTVAVVANFVSHRSAFYGITWIFDDILPTLGLNFEWPQLGVLWFVRMLFICVVISPILRKVVMNGWGLLIIGMIYLTFDWADELRLNPRFLTGLFSWEGVFYFSVGIYLRFKRDEIRCPRVLCDSLWLPLLFIICVFCIKIELALRGISVWAPIKPILIPFVLLFAWRLIPSMAWSHGIITLAFPIYLLHWFFIKLSTLIPMPVYGIIRHVLVWVFTMSASVVCTIILRRWFPRFSRYAFGGR